jgi:hypothetical protein
MLFGNADTTQAFLIGFGVTTNADLVFGVMRRTQYIEVR